MIPVLSGKSSLFMDQVHPTKAGNEVIAGELYKTVEGLPNYNAVCGGTSLADGKASGAAANPQTPVAVR
jgi:hypothetical protein